MLAALAVGITSIVTGWTKYYGLSHGPIN